MGFLDKAKDFLGTVGEKAADTFNYVGDKIGQGIGYAGDKAMQGLDYVGGKVNNVIGAVTGSIKGKQHDYNEIKQIKTREINDRDKYYVNKMNDISGGEKANTFLGTIGEAVDSFVIDPMKDFVTGDKSKADMINEYVQEKERLSGELNKELLKKIETGKLTPEQAEIEMKNRLRKKLDEYVLNSGIADSLKLSRDEWGEIDDEAKSNASTLFEKAIVGGKKGGYMGVLEEINKDNDKEIKETLKINKTDTILGNNVELLKQIQERLKENLTTIDTMKYESLVDKDFSSEEANTIFRNSELLRQAKFEYGKLMFEKTKNMLLKYPELDKEEILAKSDEEARKSLPSEYVAVLKQQDGIIGAINMGSRLYDAKANAKDFHKASTIKEKVGAYGKLFLNTVKLGMETIGTGLGMGIDVASDSISNSFRGLEQKDQDRASIFYDNYEYTLLDNGNTIKGIKHIVYNLDDIGETLLANLGTGGTSSISKATNAGKITKMLSKASSFIQDAVKGNQAIKFSIGKTGRSLITAPIELTKNVLSFAGKQGNKMAKEVVEGYLIQNPIIDRNTLSASTETNDVMNMWFDALGGRVLSGLTVGGKSAFGMNTMDKKLGSGDGWGFSSTLLDGIRYGEDFINLSEKVAKENNLTLEQASQTVKMYKATLHNLEGKLDTSKDFYDNINNVIMYARKNLVSATDFGKIVSLDNIENRYKSFSKNTDKQNYFYGALQGNEYDKQLATSMHIKTLEDFKKAMDNKWSISGYRLKLNKEAVDEYSKGIDMYIDKMKEMYNKGDIEGLYDIYEKSDSFMKDIIVDNSDDFIPKIKIYDPITKKTYSIKEKDFDTLGLREQDLDGLLKDGLVIDEGVIEGIPKGNYKVFKNNIGTNKGNIKVKDLINTKKKDGKIRYGFIKGELDIIDKYIDGVKRKDIGIVKYGYKAKYNVYKTKGKILDEGNIYGLFKDKDIWFGIIEGGYERKNKDIDYYEYLVPGKKLLDKLMIENIGLKDSNFTIDIFNTAIELGLTKENADEILPKAIELTNITKGNKELSQNNYDEILNKTLNNFKDKGINEDLLYKEGKEFKKIVEGLYNKFKIGNGADNFILKSLILKLGRNKEMFNELKTFLLKQGKDLKDIDKLNNVILGGKTFEKIKGEFKDVFDLGGIDEEIELIIKDEINDLKKQNTKLKIELKELEGTKVYGEYFKKIHSSKINSLKNSISNNFERIGLLNKNKTKKLLIENMYSKNLKSFLKRRIFDAMLKVEKNGVMGGDILDGISKVMTTDNKGYTPNEIKSMQKSKKDIENITKDIEDIGKEKGIKGIDLTDLLNKIDSEC